MDDYESYMLGEPYNKPIVFDDRVIHKRPGEAFPSWDMIDFKERMRRERLTLRERLLDGMSRWTVGKFCICIALSWIVVGLVVKLVV